MPEPAEIEHHDRQDGAQLDHHVKDLVDLVLEVQEIAGEDQMAGGGNRQKLGEALDRTEDQGRYRIVIHEILKRAGRKAWRRGLRERKRPGKGSHHGCAG